MRDYIRLQSITYRTRAHEGDRFVKRALAEAEYTHCHSRLVVKPS